MLELGSPLGSGFWLVDDEGLRGLWMAGEKGVLESKANRLAFLFINGEFFTESFLFLKYYIKY